MSVSRVPGNGRGVETLLLSVYIDMAMHLISPSSFRPFSMPLINTLGSQGWERGAAVVAFAAGVVPVNATKSVRLVTRISFQFGPVSKCGVNLPPMYTKPPSSFCWKSGAEKASAPNGNEQCDHVGHRKFPKWVT